MGFSTTDWVALFILGVSALVGTFGKRLVRIIGLAVMPFAFAGLVLSLSHHGSAPSQGPITNNAPSINTSNTNNTINQSGGADRRKELEHFGEATGGDAVVAADARALLEMEGGGEAGRGDHLVRDIERLLEADWPAQTIPANL